MSQIIEVKVPDIGDFDEVPIIDLFVKAGDAIALDQAICTLESDKATMDVPSPVAGVVKEVLVALNQKVKEGVLLIKVETGAASDASAAQTAPTPATTAAPAAAVKAGAMGKITEVKVPDIGDFDEVPIIDLFVKAGDAIALDQAICTLESDKATMDVPSPVAGVVKEVLVALNQKVKEGVLLIKVETGAAASDAPSAQTAPTPESTTASMSAPAAAPVASAAAAVTAPSNPANTSLPPALPLGSVVHASPSVRVFARELGVDLAKVTASGPGGRILREDVSAFVKKIMTSPPSAAAGSVSGGGTLDLLPWPKVDFSKFGAIELQPLSRIKKLSGQNLSRNWVMIPAVTYHEDADVTDLENFRVLLNKENEKGGIKVTMLAFMIKASVQALKKFPEFNASLDGDNLVLKKYFHIGFAADTPTGLVVPVLKNADTKSVLEIAQEASDLAKQARDGKLKPADMQGASFTISSLGGIGGTGFAPIINAPEVAILGLSKSAMKPVWDGKQFVPRLILPMSLTADHRVVDGATATRFTVYLAQLLADFRRATL